MQTFFRFYPSSIYSRCISLMSERGAHKPSPAEFLAPFHQDPTQRIIVLYMRYNPNLLVLRIGALLKLFKDREGAEIGWDEWKSCVLIPSLHCTGGPMNSTVHIFGCRLFHSYSVASGPYQMEVFDFSIQGRAKYLSKGKFEEFGEVNCLTSTGAKARIGPQGTFFCLRNSHESVIFSLVSTAVFCFLLE